MKLSVQVWISQIIQQFNLLISKKVKRKKRKEETMKIFIDFILFAIIASTFAGNDEDGRNNDGRNNDGGHGEHCRNVTCPPPIVCPPPGCYTTIDQTAIFEAMAEQATTCMELYSGVDPTRVVYSLYQACLPFSAFGFCLFGLSSISQCEGYDSTPADLGLSLPVTETCIKAQIIENIFKCAFECSITPTTTT